ncbi:hypothetical protein RB653_007120 [Dictyostelium firmibasis]|uniref:Uncharacterized protein n=1 Tax=Dictyostelium firmibasis TaxID=79012 RepID=A0AAN7TN22_9MYCE
MPFQETFTQELYTFDWNSPRVNINGQPHFKVEYYPTSANYKGDFYPDLESNPNTAKYTLKSNCTITRYTNFIDEDLLTPPINAIENPDGTLSGQIKNVLIVPEGVTVKFSGKIQRIIAIIIKGRAILDPNTDTTFISSKTIIYPTGLFESTPNNKINHTISLYGFEYFGLAWWDPLQTSTFISLGGKVNIIGFNSESMWTGRNTSLYDYYSFGGTFLRPPFSYQSSGLPLFRMNGYIDTSYKVKYSMDQYYTNATVPAAGSTQFIGEPLGFKGAGYIVMRPWTKNVWISGSLNSSMVFTLGSTVNIQNIVFYDIGHTTNAVLNDNVLNSNYNIINVAKNPPDRYPITLLHNKVAVTIKNNMFMDYDFNGIDNRLSLIPRSFIGAKRSFGIISGNAFALRKSISGISLLYGTEQFNITYNAFISLYSDNSTISSYRAYPDIDYLNGGIISTSPYSSFEGNAFEGKFKGGAIQLIPLQSRSSIFGLASDKLLGIYAGLIQDNTVDFKTNNVWNNIVFLNHFFAGETEVRVRYPLNTQPPLKINLKYGWYIGQQSSTTLGSTGNQANIEIFYDSPYIASLLTKNEKDQVLGPNTHTGKYNALTIVNALAKDNYIFFSEAFTCNYLSIKDSKFSHYSSSSLFLKKYTSQLYLSNVNGTKLDVLDLISNFYPLYNYYPAGNILTNNQLSISFNLNLEYLPSGGSQNTEYIINDVLQSTDYPTTSQTSISKVLNFPRANGPNTVLVSSNLLYAPTFASTVGPFYAQTYTIDSNSKIFYLGIDLTSDFSSSAKALSIFGNQWTKCGWIGSICKVTGKYNNVITTPSTVSESTTGTIRSAADEVSMLTTYLSNDVTLGIKSSVNVTLPAYAEYKFFIYSYNADFTGANILDSLPLFTIKINGKYQEPYSRPCPPYQKYQKFGPFYWNSGSTDVTLRIEWASDNLKYAIPMSGIEVFSNYTSPYQIPTSSTTGAVETSSKSTDSSTTTNNNNNSGELNTASSIISKSSVSTLVSFILLTHIIKTLI